MGFAYDRGQSTGTAEDHAPTVAAAFDELGYTLGSSDGQRTVSLDVDHQGPFTAHLRWDGGILTLAMPVAQAPRPGPRVAELLGRFNAQEPSLTAVSLPEASAARVELWARLVPALDTVEPFLPEDLHVLFKRLAQAKVRLSAQLAGELGATPL